MFFVMWLSRTLVSEEVTGGADLPSGVSGVLHSNPYRMYAMTREAVSRRDSGKELASTLPRKPCHPWNAVLRSPKDGGRHTVRNGSRAFAA